MPHTQNMHACPIPYTQTTATTMAGLKLPKNQHITLCYSTYNIPIQYGFLGFRQWRIDLLQPISIILPYLRKGTLSCTPFAYLGTKNRTGTRHIGGVQDYGFYGSSTYHGPPQDSPYLNQWEYFRFHNLNNKLPFLCTGNISTYFFNRNALVTHDSLYFLQ